MKTHETSRTTFPVYSGARILGKFGLPDNPESATRREVVAGLREIAPKTIIREDPGFTDDGKIMTSGGIPADIGL